MAVWGRPRCASDTTWSRRSESAYRSPGLGLGGLTVLIRVMCSSRKSRNRTSYRFRAWGPPLESRAWSMRWSYSLLPLSRVQLPHKAEGADAERKHCWFSFPILKSSPFPLSTWTPFCHLRGSSFFFNWSISDLQYCVSFRRTAKWFSYVCIIFFSDNFSL